MHARTWTLVALTAAAALTACRGGFRVNRYPTSDALYAAAMREYQERHWGNAILAFEKLTTDLSPRDTLLPRSFWYLANAHARQNEHLLAAQSYSRLFESFPDDTLADDAAFQAALSYRRLWRKPELDATYCETALATFNTMLGLYGESSPHADDARREIVELEQWFATKEYATGMFYFRRKAYDSAMIYFRNVLERWPHVPRVRDALLRLAESYRAIRYREDLDETCTQLREAYPADPEVSEVCRGTRLVADTAAGARPVVTPPMR
jgi:outer membrane protein assembly factor BamD